MNRWLQASALRQKGVWLFALVLAVFWALLALSGWGRLKASSEADRVQLQRSEALQRLELRLGDAVALSLDRVAALDLLPGRLAPKPVDTPQGCPAPAPSAPGLPLELVPSP